MVVLFAALPIGCPGDFEPLGGGAPAAAVITAHSVDADSPGWTCQQDCFCCAHVLPMGSFELPATPAAGPATLDPLSDAAVDRASAVYHPPRA